MMIDEAALQDWLDRQGFAERIGRLMHGKLKPIILFDDDPDGIISYVLFRRKALFAQPRLVRGTPILEKRLVQRIPSDVDLTIILDKPGVEEDLARLLPEPVVWIDHHPPATQTLGVYVNPTHAMGLHATTSLLVHMLFPDTPAWLALVGSIADHAYPERLVERMKQDYPFLFEGWDGTLVSLKFDTPLARIIRLVSFSVKGDVRNAYAMLRALVSVQRPEDILVARSGMMGEVWEKYERMEKAYLEQLRDAYAHARDLGRVLAYTYTREGMSFTVDLANELAARTGKIIIVGRPYNGQVLFSIRSSREPIVSAVQQAALLAGGTGGGHTHACGARIPEDQAEFFIQTFAKLLEEGEGEEKRDASA